MSASHTPGPWRWEINRQSKAIHLVGGIPKFDKTVMDFDRWGIGGAAPRFNETIAGGVYNIMSRVNDRQEWIAPFPGREHHANWCADITHPDARLIAAAPDLLQAAQAAEAVLSRQKWVEGSTDPEAVALFKLRAAIAKATGRTA